MPSQWLKRFKKWITQGRHRELDVFETILDTYAGIASSVDQMRQCRVNPDLASTRRNDLEFYIPQLCGYLIDDSKPRELRDCLFVILLEAANANFYFSHRLYFFLHAYVIDQGLSESVRTV